MKLTQTPYKKSLKTILPFFLLFNLLFSSGFDDIFHKYNIVSVFGHKYSFRNVTFDLVDNSDLVPVQDSFITEILSFSIPIEINNFSLLIQSQKDGRAPPLFIAA